MTIDLTIDPQFLRHVAVCTVLIIVGAFALGGFKSKKKTRIVPSAVWDASSYYMYVNALIASSITLEQLAASQHLLKGFLTNAFQEPLSQKDRQRYFNRITEAYSKKESELTVKQSKSFFHSS